MSKFWKKIVSVGVAFTMAGTLLMGCGGSSDDSSDADSTDADSSESTASSSDAKEVTLWHYFENEADDLEEIVEEYNQMQSDIHITVTYVARDELMNQYTIGAVSGELPDIGMVDSPDMASYVSLGVFEDITSQLEEWGELDKFYTGTLSSCKDSKGNLYGLPNNSNCLALLCNMDLLNAAGYEDVPETWEEFEEIAAATTNAGDNVYGFSMSLIGNEEGTFQYIPWLYAAGGSVADLSSDKSVKSLDFLSNLIAQGYLSKESVNWTQADAYNAFIAGKAAMLESGTWQIASLDDDIADAGTDINYKYCFLPKDETYASVIGGENFGVCTGSEATDECVDFLTWFHSAEKNGEFATRSGKLVVREDAEEYNELIEDERFAVFSDAMEYAVARGPHESWPTISEAIYTAVQGAAIGEKTAADAMAEGAAVVDPILEETPLPEQ